MVEEVQQIMSLLPRDGAQGGPDVMWSSDLCAGRTVVNKDVLRDDMASFHQAPSSSRSFDTTTTVRHLIM
jgi:hypothetical protein